MLCHRTSSTATIQLQWLVGTSWDPPISALHSTGLRTCTSVPRSYMNAGDASPGPHYCSADTLLPELFPEPCVSVCPPSLLPQESLAHYAVQDGIKLVTLQSWFPGMHRHMTYDPYDRPWCWVKMGYHPVEAWFHLCMYGVCIWEVGSPVPGSQLCCSILHILCLAHACNLHRCGHWETALQEWVLSFCHMGSRN